MDLIVVEITHNSEAMERVNKGNTKGFLSDVIVSLHGALLLAPKIVYALLP